MRPRNMKSSALAIIAALLLPACNGCSDAVPSADAEVPDVGTPDSGIGRNPDAAPPGPVIPEPTLDAIVPSSGPETGGTRVTLRGDNYLEPATVLFGGVEATNVIVLDHTQIAATTPAGMIGPADVTVRTAGGEATLMGAYRYHRDLRITAVTPARLPEEGGVPIVIEGKGFTDKTLILFDRRPVIGARWVNAERIEAIAPALSPGRPEIHAAATDAEAKRSDLVIVYATPELRVIVPGYGPILGGTNQTMDGQGFIGISRVAIGTSRATELTVVDDSRITVEAPALSEGAHDVIVSNADVSDTLVGGYIAFDPRLGAQLAILGVTPGRGSTLGGDVVTVVGHGFGLDSVVRIGGLAAAQASIDAPFAVSVVIPAGLPVGLVDVELTTRGSTATRAAAIEIHAPIVLTAVTPARGPVSGGTAITITGSGLSQIGLDLRLGDVRLDDVVVVDDTTVTARTHAGGHGSQALIGRIPGASGRLDDAFFFEEGFEVIRVDPSEGSIAGNTLVSVLGRGFSGTASVTFDRVAAFGIQIENGSVISGRTQPAGTGRIDVFAGTEDGQATLTNAYTFYDPRIITGGAWGGPIEGSVNVGVLDARTGEGIPGMVVQLGLDADPRYAGITDINGLATISWPEVKGPQTVTAGQTAFEFVTFPEINARNLTMFSGAYPAQPPPDAPVQPCPAGAQAPLVRGNVFKFKSSIDPATRPGWIPLARITYSDSSVFGPNPVEPPEQVDFVFEDGGEFEIVVMRGGTVAVFAVLGDFNPETQEFIPRRMGIVRSVPASPGETTTGVNIPLDIELDRTIQLRLDDPPHLVPGPQLNAVFPFLNLGSDGVIPFNPTVVPENATITVSGMPNLPGADFYYMAGAFTTDGLGGIGAPFSLTLGQSDDDGTNGVDVGPYLRMPEDVQPKRGQILEHGDLSWAQPGIKPDLTSITISDQTVISGQCCIDIDMNGECGALEPVQGGSAPVGFTRWSLFGPGGLQSYPLPAMPPGVVAFDLPSVNQWVTDQAIAPRFDYREWIYNQYSPFFWKSWSVSFELFLAKEEAE